MAIKSKRQISIFLIIMTVTMLSELITEACTRVMYEAADGHMLLARSMDWVEDLHSDIWVYPRGMKKDGGVGPDSIKWVSKYGSVTLSGYDIGTADGMNEKGLVANLLYLAEADYGNINAKPVISIGAWAQYILDNYGTVAEAVNALRSEPFRIIATDLPNGSAPGLHVSISDPDGDSAIFEYIDGKLVIHHDKAYTVMTNSPTYDEQLTLNAYWQQIGGLTMLPGTNRASDRFVRASYYSKAVPKFKDERMAVSGAFSIVRNASVPLGISDPAKPNIASTIWRVVSDQKNRVYYYESAISPNIFWVDMNNINFDQFDKPMRIDLDGHPTLSGEVSASFVEAEPFKWLAPTSH